jgi:hypothetical protein
MFSAWLWRRLGMLFEQAMEIDDPGRVLDGAVWSHTGFDPDDGADLRALLQQMRGDRLMEATEPQILPGLPDGFDLDMTSRKQSDGFLMFGQAPGDEDVTEVEPIVVEGRRPPTAVSPGWGDGSEYPPVPDGGGGGGEDTSQDPPIDRPEGWDSCQDRAADELAAIAALALSLLPDIDSREYGYIIYRDANGDLKLSTLISGDNDLLTGLNPSSVPSDFGFQSWSQVVGIIHSHPVIRYREDGSEVRVHPDDNHHLPNLEDWDWPDFWVRQGADGVNLRQYIYHDGQAHEFNYYNNREGDGERTNGAENTGGTCG